MRCFLLPFFLALLIIIVDSVSSFGYDLVVSNTGPAVLNSPIKFTATFNPFFLETYMVVFEDDTPQGFSRSVYADNEASATFVYNFSNPDVDRHYRMKVEVWSLIVKIPFTVVASAETLFMIKDSLVGNVNYTEAEIPPMAITNSYVASNKTVNFTAVLHDPLHFFADGTAVYSWSINEKPAQSNSSHMSWNFTSAGGYDIKAVVKVKKANLTTEFNGELKRHIEVKIPVNGITAAGKKVISRDDDLNLDISCGGSPPFWYCTDIIAAANSTGHIDCDKEKYIDKCAFRIVRYLRTNGSYLLFVKIRNNVSFFVNKTIEVTILDINNQPQLSVVIIPVFSSIIAIVIIVGGIAYHLKQRERYAVEVADFDFQQHDDLENLCEKTLLERIQESFSSSLKRGILTSCRRRTYDSLVDDQDATSDVPTDDSYEDDRRNRVGLGSPVDDK